MALRSIGLSASNPTSTINDADYTLQSYDISALADGNPALAVSFGLNAAFLTGDLFNLFVAFEVVLLASYLLIQVPGSDRSLAALLRPPMDRRSWDLRTAVRGWAKGYT